MYFLVAFPLGTAPWGGEHKNSEDGKREQEKYHGSRATFKPINQNQATGLSPKILSLLTGSVSMVRRWEASARTARLLNTTPLITAYQKLLEGSSMTKVTTKSAKKTRNQVMKAHTMPQQSWINQSCLASLWEIVSTASSSPSSRGRCCSTSLRRWPEDILPWPGGIEKDRWV